jgi:nucleoside-diphosphate-sugar epimerase
MKARCEKNLTLSDRVRSEVKESSCRLSVQANQKMTRIISVDVRILLIGGTGFIGSAIVRQLAGAGLDVAIFHRGHTRVELPRGVREFVDPLSVLPIEKFPRPVLEFQPEIVVHTMAMGERDTRAAIAAFHGIAARFVLLSSGDVYRAYGRFTGIEAGPVEEGLLSEHSRLRTVRFPYRMRAASNDALEYWYEKIVAEEIAINSGMEATVLRLPKVYGPASNANLATLYAYRNHPTWRWTHGYVENVAAAVVVAASHPRAANRIYNVGEEYTPTIGERLVWMPSSGVQTDDDNSFDFAQNIAYDTTRIRNELGYKEIMAEGEAMLETLRGKQASD